MASKLAKKRIVARVLGAMGFWRKARHLMAITGPNLPSEGVAQHPDVGRYRGAIHCHTAQYSDGAGSVEDVMQAAKNEGFDFVFLTDHNSLGATVDGYVESYQGRRPFLRVGSEITVSGGTFLLAGCLPNDFVLKPRLGSQAAVDAVLNNKGIALISLPYDMKHPWEDWSTQGISGIEVINFSTVARDHINLLSLAVILCLWRCCGLRSAICWMIDRPDTAFKRWDAEIVTRGHFVGVGSLDAHGITRIGKKWHKFPSYEDSFCALSTHVFVRGDLDDESAVEAALFTGKSVIVFDLVRPFTGTVVQTSYGKLPGDQTCVGDTIELHVTDFTLTRIYHDGNLVLRTTACTLRFPLSSVGAYRIECFTFQHQFGTLVFFTKPWFFTNPFYVTVLDHPMHTGA